MPGISTKTIWTEDLLEQLCSEGEPESDTLDFKSGRALLKTGKELEDEKTEISRDIASLANAGGGIIVYGVKTKKNPNTGIDSASHLEPINDPKINDSWLTSVILTRTHPARINFSVVAVPCVKVAGSALVVIVEESMEPIQAHDYVFYQRIQTQKRPLRPAQVDDIRRRQIAPALDLEFSFNETPAYMHWDERSDAKYAETHVAIQIKNYSPTPATHALIRLWVDMRMGLLLPPNHRLQKQAQENLEVLVEGVEGRYRSERFLGFTRQIHVNGNDLPLFQEMPQPLSDPIKIRLAKEYQVCLKPLVFRIPYEIFAPGMKTVRDCIELNYSINNFESNTKTSERLGSDYPAWRK